MTLEHLFLLNSLWIWGLYAMCQVEFIHNEQLDAYLQRIDNLKALFKDVSVTDIKGKISDVEKQIADLKQEARDLPINLDRGERLEEIKKRIDDLNLRITTGKAVILDRAAAEKRAADEAIRNADIQSLAQVNLSKLTKQQLTDQIASIKARKDNGKGIADEVERREKALEDLIKLEQQATDKILAARQAASDKLKEQTLKDTQDALSAQEISNSDKLKQEQKNAEQNANILFEQSRKTKEDAENLAADLLAIRQKFDAAIEKATIDEAASRCSNNAFFLLSYTRSESAPRSFLTSKASSSASKASN